MQGVLRYAKKLERRDPELILRDTEALRRPKNGSAKQNCNTHCHAGGELRRVQKRSDTNPTFEDCSQALAELAIRIFTDCIFKTMCFAVISCKEGAVFSQAAF